MHARVRKIIKTRGHVPTDEAATKLIWLALRNIMAGRGDAARERGTLPYNNSRSCTATAS